MPGLIFVGRLPPKTNNTLSYQNHFLTPPQFCLSFSFSCHQPKCLLHLQFLLIGNSCSKLPRSQKEANHFYLPPFYLLKTDSIEFPHQGKKGNKSSANGLTFERKGVRNMISLMLNRRMSTTSTLLKKSAGESCLHIHIFFLFLPLLFPSRSTFRET